MQVRAGIENLRRALDEREAQLLSGIEDVTANPNPHSLTCNF